MSKIMAGLALVCVCGIPALSQTDTNPFIGRWDFNLQSVGTNRADWLGITQNNGTLDVWFQPTGGHVFQPKDVKAEGSHLSFTAEPASDNHPAMTWELDASGDKLTGTQKRGDESTPLVGTRAPKLDREAPAAWTKPHSLFNGKNLNGWQPVGDVANNHWVVKDGVLLNESHGANLRTVEEFTDFKAHFEVMCPEESNSGFYLRGRYELQLEYEPGDTEPAERAMGSIYGRIPPSQKLPRTPGKWESFDVTLVGHTVSVARNGVQIIENKEIEGVTGGALDANEGDPGPFYIQGDHTGGLKFRNITVAVPKQKT